MARRKKTSVITVEEVVYALLRRAAEKDGWTLDYHDENDDMSFADAYHLRVDQRTCMVGGVGIMPMDMEFCEQSFSFECLDGLTFTTAVRPGETPVWRSSVELPFLYYKDAETQRRLLDEMQRLINECVELEMFDPSCAWCPEGLDDLPVSDAAELLEADARYFFKWVPGPDGAEPDEEYKELCVCRSDEDLKKIMSGTKSKSPGRRTAVREVTLDEAADFLRTSGIADDIYWDSWPAQADSRE